MLQITITYYNVIWRQFDHSSWCVGSSNAPWAALRSDSARLTSKCLATVMARKFQVYVSYKPFDVDL
jgi:hypothetical protein